MLRVGIAPPCKACFQSDQRGARHWRIAPLLLDSAKNQRHCVAKLFRVEHLVYQLLSALSRAGVELGFTPGVRIFPLGLEPPTLLQPMEGRVQRTLRDLEEIAGKLLNTLGDGVAVIGTAATTLRMRISRAWLSLEAWPTPRHLLGPQGKKCQEKVRQVASCCRRMVPTICSRSAGVH